MNLEVIGILLTIVIQALYVAHKIGRFEEKLYTIEKKQDKHNNIIEKVYKHENDISILYEKSSVENHRIEDLEHVQQGCKYSIRSSKNG